MNVLDDKSLKEIMNKISEERIKAKNIVLVCVGTDKHLIDSFGPLVGEMIKDKEYKNITCYGNLNKPIHALNLTEIFKDIKLKHCNDLIIGIDACISYKKYETSSLLYDYTALCPGKGVGKKLDTIGDMRICFPVYEGYTDLLHKSVNVIRLNEIYVASKKVINIIDEIDYLVSSIDQANKDSFEEYTF